MVEPEQSIESRAWVSLLDAEKLVGVNHGWIRMMADTGQVHKKNGIYGQLYSRSDIEKAVESKAVLPAIDGS